jgi:hypothetical protein
MDERCWGWLVDFEELFDFGFVRVKEKSIRNDELKEMSQCSS